MGCMKREIISKVGSFLKDVSGTAANISDNINTINNIVNITKIAADQTLDTIQDFDPVEFHKRK